MLTIHGEPLLNLILEVPNIFETLYLDKFKADFEYNNKLLDEIQKKDCRIILKKTLDFPKFYFLADDELLEIVCKTK